MLRTRQICEQQKLSTFVLAMLVVMTVWAIATRSAFADLSPDFVAATPGPKVNSPVQLAQANLPSVGSVDDYMHQDGDGPSTSAVPPSGYSPQAIPPQKYYPQGVPSQEWNNGYVDPNAQRSALIGAAVVGALAVGLWAWQQHELQQSRRYVPPRKRHNRRPAFDNQVE